MRMKTRNLFALALATMAFAACNNDDDATNGGNNGKGEEIDQIGVSFAPTTTYGDNGTMTGTGTENNVYKAFVFAHETNASGLMPGDWSVQEVGDGLAAINATAGAGATSLNNMATFHRVTMGENVYVLVNVPGLTKAQAEVVAHKGANSEQSIKEYVYNVSKDYLNGLTYKSDAAATGKFVMAGMATIPTNPVTPNGGTVTVPVELNREMAKVHFQALLTADNTKEAYGKVKIDQSTDGIIIARISRQVSPFTKWEKDWYFPLSASDNDKDWDATWTTAFNGETNTTPSTSGTGFNTTVSKTDAKEYRYTWMNEDSGKLTIDTDGKLTSPYFYVTPNYANDANCVSVICTQATYTGAPVFADENANKLFVGAYGKYIAGHTSDFKKEDSTPADAFKDCKWDDTAMTHVSTYFGGNITADIPNLAIQSGLQESEVQAAANKIKAVTKATSTHANLSYYTNQKVFYRADIANYDASGAVSGNITERNTYYQVEGTITSLGAPTIEGAITSDNISMLVKVKVMPWKWVVNRVDM